MRLGTPSSFCSATLRSNAATSLGAVEQEQVADPAQVDLLAGPLRRTGERLQAARAELRC